MAQDVASYAGVDLNQPTFNGLTSSFIGLAGRPVIAEPAPVDKNEYEIPVNLGREGPSIDADGLCNCGRCQGNVCKRLRDDKRREQRDI